MSDDRIDQYNYLCSNRDISRNWFKVTILIFSCCIGMAFNQGAVNGWVWLVASLASMFVALFSLIEIKHYELLLALHMLPSELISRKEF